MRKLYEKIAVLILVTAMTMLGGCVLEEKIIEIVLNDEGCAEFEEDHDSAEFETSDYIFFADEIDEVLEENDYSRDMIKECNVISGSYEVTEFSHKHDWIISGSITIARVDEKDGPVPILDYTSQSVKAALGVKIPAKLNKEGVDLLNRALDDYLSGATPILIFTVKNATVGPTEPSASDRMVFNWKACLLVYLVAETELEVPDPF